MEQQDPVCHHGRPECQCLDKAIEEATAAAANAGASLTIHTTITNGLDAKNAAQNIVNSLNANGPMTSIDNAFGGLVAAGSQGTCTGFGGAYTDPSWVVTGIGTSVPQTTTDFVWNTPPVADPAVACTEHEIEEDSIELRGDEMWGYCSQCYDAVRIPRIVGSFNFEKAGRFIGRAMTIEDDENSAELLAELNIFEQQIQDELARYKRALKMITVARTVAKNQVVERVAELAE